MTVNRTIRLLPFALLAALVGTGSARAQLGTTPNTFAPPRPNAVKPNSQNLMQGPSYWTPNQRRLNVPGADSNPTTRRQTEPWAPAPIPVPAPKAPAPKAPAD